MNKFIRDNWKWLLIGILGTLIVMPALTQLLINVDTSNKGSDDGWLGFWGGYLGAIIGVAGAIFVVQIQLNEDKKGREAEKIDNTYFNLLSMHNEQKNILIGVNIFEIIYLNFKKELEIQLLDEGLDFFYSKKVIISEMLQDLLSAYKKNIENQEGKISPEFLERWKRKKRGEMFSDEYPVTEESRLYEDLCWSLIEIKEIEKFLIDVENKRINHFSDKIFKGVDGVYEELDKHIDRSRSIQWDIPDELSKLKVTLRNFQFGHIELLPNDRKRKAIELAINTYYSEIGAYFRIFHRIIKYINDKVKDEETKKDYLDFLRATINEKEMLVIFYNAAYTERGKELLKEIRKTTFFGEHQDLLENRTVQYFNSDSLIWKSEDLKIMREFGKK